MRRRTRPPRPSPPPRDAKPKLAKGTRVQITGGRDGAGETGEVFWVGESRYGKGNRYGIRGKDDATFWVDDEFVEPLDPPAGGDAGAATADGHDPAPLPNPDDFAADFADDAPIHDGAPLASDAPAEFAGGDDAPFPSEDDEAAGGAGGGGFDAPFPDDDIPF